MEEDSFAPPSLLSSSFPVDEPELTSDFSPSFLAKAVEGVTRFSSAVTGGRSPMQIFSGTEMLIVTL